MPIGLTQNERVFTCLPRGSKLSSTVGYTCLCTAVGATGVSFSASSVHGYVICIVASMKAAQYVNLVYVTYDIITPLCAACVLKPNVLGLLNGIFISQILANCYTHCVRADQDPR